MVDALTPAGTRLRNSRGQLRGDDPVLDDHGHDPPPRTPWASRNRPFASLTSQPRATRRFAFERTPSLFAAVPSKPSTPVSSLHANASSSLLRSRSDRTVM